MPSFNQVNRHPRYKEVIGPLAAKIHQQQCPKVSVFKNHFPWNVVIATAKPPVPFNIIYFLRCYFFHLRWEIAKPYITDKYPGNAYSGIYIKRCTPSIGYRYRNNDERGYCRTDLRANT